MISPLRNIAHPFTLPSSIVYFHDWRYVHHGNVCWKGIDGQPIEAAWTEGPLLPMRYEPKFLPTGITIKAQPATKSEPFLSPEMIDEKFLFAGTVMQDDGKYRLWVECLPSEHIKHPKLVMGLYNYVRYCESDNGVDWRFPKLGLVDRHGSKDNNVVFGPTEGDPPLGYHGGCVFKDPSAPPTERYKMFFQDHIIGEAADRYRREHPDLVYDAVQWPGWVWRLCGAVSPDGLRWTRLAEPLSHQLSDTLNACEYDPVLGKYVAYVRNWFFSRRGIGRTISDEFRHFPMSEEVLWPDATVEPDVLWYANGKTRMPAAGDYHIMFPMRWRILDDKFEFHLAASPDNLTWGRVPGGAVCQAGQPGAWDCGVVLPWVGMVNLPGDRIGIPISGTTVPHKHPRQAPFGKVAWAWWPKGRLTALEAPAEGRFALWPLKAPQRNVHLNFKTAPAGRIEVEACDDKGQPIQGRGFEDCDRLVGDELDKLVTWKGQPDLGHGEVVTLCFRMSRAALYSVEFK